MHVLAIARTIYIEYLTNLNKNVLAIARTILIEYLTKLEHECPRDCQDNFD